MAVVARLIYPRWWGAVRTNLPTVVEATGTN